MKIREALSGEGAAKYRSGDIGREARRQITARRGKDINSNIPAADSVHLGRSPSERHIFVDLRLRRGQAENRNHILRVSAGCILRSRDAAHRSRGPAGAGPGVGSVRPIGWEKGAIWELQ